MANHGTDYSISSTLGLSYGVVAILFMILLSSIELAGLNIMGLITGDSITSGDPTVFYFALFLVAASMLIVVQHHISHLAQESER